MNHQQRQASTCHAGPPQDEDADERRDSRISDWIDEPRPGRSSASRCGASESAARQGRRRPKLAQSRRCSATTTPLPGRGAAQLGEQGDRAPRRCGARARREQQQAASIEPSAAGRRRKSAGSAATCCRETPAPGQSRAPSSRPGRRCRTPAAAAPNNPVNASDDSSSPAWMLIHAPGGIQAPVRNPLPSRQVERS